MKHAFCSETALSQYPYPSIRTAAAAANGMVATSQHLAAQAGLSVLQKGGNAVDAAIAAAACLTVVEPTSNGIGGDNFAIVWNKGSLYGLNSSGPAPMSLSADKLREKGLEEMPRFGWTPVTVPGVPAGWEALSRRFGILPFRELMEPAVQYADGGFAVSPTVAHYWKRAADTYSSAGKGRNDYGTDFSNWFSTFTKEGKTPQAGELWKLPDHAATLDLIGRSGSREFYQGLLAEALDKASAAGGGYIRKSDMAGFAPRWVNPVSIRYRGYDIWELPPNVQGIIALMALQIVKGMDIRTMDQKEVMHCSIEAMKLAFADGLAHITDPGSMKFPLEDLLSDTYGEVRRAEIKPSACLPKPLPLPSGGTVYLAAADSSGMMVSFIQSNYMGFGSGIVVPGTGIALQNRGHNFSLDSGHVNCLEPGKRTYHTIMPGFITKPAALTGPAGEQGSVPIGPFGVMGGFMQPQGHMQVAMRMIDEGLNPQSALDAPRWQWTEGLKVMVEDAVPETVTDDLQRRGHTVTRVPVSGTFGRGQVIVRNDEGVLLGGTDPRTDGAVCSW